MFGLVIQKTKLCSSKMQPLQSLFSLLFPVSRPRYLCGLLGLTGACKDLLWYLVFVERDQQARTSSLRSSPDSPTSFHEQLSRSLSPAPPSPYSASAYGTPSALMHTRCQIWQRSKKAQIAPECVQAHTVHSHSWICRCDSCREGCPNTATSDSTSSESEHVEVCSNLPSGGSLLVCLRWQKVKRLEVSVICDEGNSRLRDVRSSLYKKAKWYHLQWFGIFDLPTHIHASPCIIMSLQPTSFCNSYWHTWVWQLMGIHVWVLSKITSRHLVPALLGFVRLSSPKWKLNKITNVKYLPREFAKWKIKE